MSISSMFAWERTLWQSQTQHGKVFKVVLQNYAGRPLKGTFGTHYSKPISLSRLKVTLSRWPPISVITTDCLTATDITSLKTCLAYYRLVPLVGAVGHVSQTVTVNHPRYGAVSRPLKLYVNIPFARRSIFFVERHIVLDYWIDAELVHFCLMCMMVLPRNIDSSMYHPVVLEGHVCIFIICTFFVCTRDVHMFCTDVSVNTSNHEHVHMHTWINTKWSELQGCAKPCAKAHASTHTRSEASYIGLHPIQRQLYVGCEKSALKTILIIPLWLLQLKYTHTQTGASSTWNLSVAWSSSLKDGILSTSDYITCLMSQSQGTAHQYLALRLALISQG